MDKQSLVERVIELTKGLSDKSKPSSIKLKKLREKYQEMSISELKAILIIQAMME